MIVDSDCLSLEVEVSTIERKDFSHAHPGIPRNIKNCFVRLSRRHNNPCGLFVGEERSGHTACIRSEFKVFGFDLGSADTAPSGVIQYRENRPKYIQNSFSRH